MCISQGNVAVALLKCDAKQMGRNKKEGERRREREREARENGKEGA